VGSPSWTSTTGEARATAEPTATGSTANGGVVDTADCVNAAEHLADRGRVDGDRLAIEGGSAGGYATLCGLTFHDTFDAGVSHFGVADVEALARDTHKFESRYFDGLIGPLPEARETYRERSPVHHAERIGCPALLLQGGEDAVVPASQAKGMIAALADIGVPHAYLEFESEQYGFRQADSIRRAAAAELSFYGQVFGFTPADDLEPVTLTPEERLPGAVLSSGTVRPERTDLDATGRARCGDVRSRRSGGYRSRSADRVTICTVNGSRLPERDRNVAG